MNLNGNLYRSLYQQADTHIAIVEALSTKGKGLPALTRWGY